MQDVFASARKSQLPDTSVPEPAQATQPTVFVASLGDDPHDGDVLARPPPQVPDEVVAAETPQSEQCGNDFIASDDDDTTEVFSMDETLPDQPLAIHMPNVSVLPTRTRRVPGFPPWPSCGNVNIVTEHNAALYVTRVYRKPRQRVRWTCDRCETGFAGRNNCRTCGHVKCTDCTRYP